MRLSARAPIVILLLLLAGSGCGDSRDEGPPARTGTVVAYGRGPTGAPLRGLLYLPPGPGPFPVILYAHGSAPGETSNAAFEAIAPVFTRRGWALFAPYRRGQGLSAEAGPYVRHEIAAARTAGGADGAQGRLAELLSGDQMADQAEALAWLQRQGFADRRRIAAMGNSFGGIIALLAAERLAVCAAVDFAGGAESWADAPALRRLMAGAVERATPPILFVQAQNDHDLSPSRILDGLRRRAGRPTEVRIYPDFGRSAADGHAFAYRGVALWEGDVAAFLDRSCR